MLRLLLCLFVLFGCLFLCFCVGGGCLLLFLVCGFGLWFFVFHDVFLLNGFENTVNGFEIFCKVTTAEGGNFAKMSKRVEKSLKMIV